MKGRGNYVFPTLTPTLSPAYRQAGIKGEGRDVYFPLSRALSLRIVFTRAMSRFT
jgi:hypothetical protein